MGTLGCLVAALLVLLTAGCGDSSSPSVKRPGDVAPRGAVAYVETSLRPRGEARGFLAGVLKQEPLEDREFAGELLKFVGLTGEFDSDVEPWLGGRGALFFVEAGGDPAATGLVLEVARRAEAKRFLSDHLGGSPERSRYRRREVWTASDGRAGAMVDGWLVLTSSMAVLRASIDATPRPLSSTTRYQRLIEGEREPLAFALAKGEGAEHALRRAGLLGAESLGGFNQSPVPASGMAAKLTLEGPQAVLEIRGLTAAEKPAPSIAGLPGDAWLAFSSNAMGQVASGTPTEATGLESRYLPLLQQFLRSELPRPVVRGLGRGTFFIQGGSAEDLSGELLARIKDPRTAWRSLLALGRRLERAGTHEVDASGTGATYRFTAESLRPEKLLRFHIRIGGQQLRLEFGLPGSADELEDTAAYRQATAALSGPPRSLVRVEEVVRLVGLRGAKQALGLEQLAWLAATDQPEGDQPVRRLAVRLANR